MAAFFLESPFPSVKAATTTSSIEIVEVRAATAINKKKIIEKMKKRKEIIIEDPADINVCDGCS